MITHVKVTTFSGSEYEFKQTISGWEVRANLIPNPESSSIGEGQWWPIKMPSPWPPQHNVGMLFVSSDNDKVYYLRMPGGGRLTSPVVNIEILEFE